MDIEEIRTAGRTVARYDALLELLFALDHSYSDEYKLHYRGAEILDLSSYDIDLFRGIVKEELDKFSKKSIN